MDWPSPLSGDLDSCAGANRINQPFFFSSHSPIKYNYSYHIISNPSISSSENPNCSPIEIPIYDDIPSNYPSKDKISIWNPMNYRDEIGTLKEKIHEILFMIPKNRLNLI